MADGPAHCVEKVGDTQQSPINNSVCLFFILFCFELFFLLNKEMKFFSYLEVILPSLFFDFMVNTTQQK